jgi:hypothetical protein
MNSSDRTDDPRRRVLLQALAAGAFNGGLVPGRALADIFGKPPSKLPDSQSIYRVSGTVAVNGVRAHLGTRIGPNDTVETGKDGEIVFVVGTSAYMLGAGSKLVLQGKPEGASIVTSALRLLTGRVLAVFGKSPAGIRLDTITATIGIRGTGVYLEAEPDLTYFCTCYGIADVASTKDPANRDTIESRHHDKPLYISADSKSKGQNIRRAPFRNHTDQELMLIETLVGRTPPFVFPGDDYEAPRRDY